jgi:ABC-type sugar transport system substrate-binding protein
MKSTVKTVLVFLTMVAFLFCAGQLFAGGGQEKKAGEEAKKAEIEAGKAKAAKGAYGVYESYVALAKDGKPFPGAPGKGKKLAFANFSVSFPFCASVEKNIKEVAALAGFDPADLIILDNQYNATIGLQNADIVLSKKPDAFIEFQVDAKVNAILAQKFKNAGIPVIAIDIEVPGSPFVGVDNYGSSYQSGLWIMDQVQKKWGGPAGVDLVIIGAQEQAGEAVLLRSLGTRDALVEKFGKDFEKKIELQQLGSTAQDAQPLTAAILAKHPDAKNVVIQCLNDQTTRGALSAVQAAGTLERQNVIFVSTGVDTSGIEMLRNKEIDGDLAYFPEHYGWYAVSAAVAMIQGQPVPPYMFIENSMITPDNVGKWYPK